LPFALLCSALLVGDTACSSTADQPIAGGSAGTSSSGNGGSDGSGGDIGSTEAGGSGGTPSNPGGGGVSIAVAADSGIGQNGDVDSASGDDHPQGDAASAIDRSTTIAILAAQSADCLACAQANGCLDPDQSGGTCELVTGNAASGGLTEAALCRKTLNDVISSQCDATLLQLECMCGPISTDDCLAGTVAPMGAAYQDYVDDFGNDINAIQANFEMTTYGSGMANVIIDCVGALGCHCVGD
jgi:hypothetical protein